MSAHRMFYTQEEINTETWIDKAMFTIHSVYYNVSESIIVFFERVCSDLSN